MGIYDRDYYRRETAGRLFGRFGDRSSVCTTLIIINVVVFIVQLATRQRIPFHGGWAAGWFTEAFRLDVNAVLHGEVWRLLTGAFLHAYNDPYPWHIVFNMLFLWWAGSAVEDIYGSREFLAFYLTSAVIASLGYVGFCAASGEIHKTALGASGAVTAVLVVFAMHYPYRTVLLFFVLPVPVWFLVVFQVLQDVLGLMGGVADRVAFAAHLSGAAFGFLYHRNQWRILNWLPSWPSGKRAGRANRPRLRVFKDEPAPEREPQPAAAPASTPAASAPAPANPAASANNDEHLEAKLDEVLEKVARHGQDSLTEGEREILFRASEIYKRRRKG